MRKGSSESLFIYLITEQEISNKVTPRSAAPSFIFCTPLEYNINTRTVYDRHPTLLEEEWSLPEWFREKLMLKIMMTFRLSILLFEILVTLHLVIVGWWIQFSSLFICLPFFLPLQQKELIHTAFQSKQRRTIPAPDQQYAAYTKIKRYRSKTHLSLNDNCIYLYWF